MSADVVCLGETMALLVPDPPVRLVDAEHLLLSHAGAESNVAVWLARLGTAVRWCSRLGDDAFGRRILTSLAAAGVDVATTPLVPGARTGVFFKDPADETTSVHYYRDGSAASQLSPADADSALAGGPQVLHLTGITPALSPSCAATVEHAIVRARELGCTVSVDVNHRPALWPDLGTAARRLRDLAQDADIVFVGADEAARLWGTTSAQDVRTLLDRPAVLVVKDGPHCADAFEQDRHVRVAALPVTVVEPVGAGDAFAAGWLHARLTGLDAAGQLRLGHLVAGCALGSVTDHVPTIPAGLVERAASGDAWPPAERERA